MILTVYLTHLDLSPTKLTIKKGRDKTTQLLFADLRHASVFTDTAELLEYLENMTEEVRLIDMEQNVKEL